MRFPSSPRRTEYRLYSAILMELQFGLSASLPALMRRRLAQLGAGVLRGRPPPAPRGYPGGTQRQALGAAQPLVVVGGAPHARVSSFPLDGPRLEDALTATRRGPRARRRDGKCLARRHRAILGLADPASASPAPTGAGSRSGRIPSSGAYRSNAGPNFASQTSKVAEESPGIRHDAGAAEGAVSATDNKHRADCGPTAIPVGTRVTPRPPDRSERALLTHSAPTSGVGRESGPAARGVGPWRMESSARRSASSAAMAPWPSGCAA